MDLVRLHSGQDIMPWKGNKFRNNRTAQEIADIHRLLGLGVIDVSNRMDNIHGCDDVSSGQQHIAARNHLRPGNAAHKQLRQ